MWILQIEFNTDFLAFDAKQILPLYIPVKRVTFTAFEYNSMRIDDEEYIRIQHGIYKSQEFIIARKNIVRIEIL